MRRWWIIGVAGFWLLAGGAGAEEEGSVLERVAAGEHWYAMLGPDGRPTGYAKLVVGRPEGGGLSIDWELAIAPGGDKYEETRRFVLDGAGDLVESELRQFGNLLGRAKREGDKLVVTTLVDGKPADREVDPTPGAMNGMGYVLAAAVPREDGGRLARPELDEANGHVLLGETVMTFEGIEKREWEGETLEVAKIRLVKANGRALPLLITADGRILEADWGRGNRMVLAKKSTKDLYKPPPPVVVEVPSDEPYLVMKGELEKFSPEEVYDHYTQPELLGKFWAPQAVVEAKPGGKYELTWPAQGWKLIGVVKEAERGERLTFTWNWEHAPDAPEQTVTLTFAPREGGGTRIGVRHGPYEASEEDATLRASHREGWVYFFGRLRALR